MKSNKERVYDFLSSISSQQENTVSTQKIAQTLKLQRTNVSSILNQLVLEKKIKKIKGRPVLYRVLSKETEEVSFSYLIGSESSLKNQIQLAKAAILYPKKSLSTLITGPSGAGKSYFSWLMYQYALQKGVLTKKAPFIKVNCNHYVYEEKLLIEHLFEKVSDEELSYFEQSHHGVLFIDNVHLLSAKARTLLFQYMDTGYYLNNGKKRYVETILICACDENVSGTMLESYFQKFPMKISIPSLSKRTLQERFELIQRFFMVEAARIGKVLTINAELLRCLMLYDCEKNIKQLRNDITIGCANAFVREFGLDSSVLPVYISDFEHYVRKGFLNYSLYRYELEEIIPENYSYSFHDSAMETAELIEDKKDQKNIYQQIRRRAQDLADRGVSDKELLSIMSIDVENMFKRYDKTLNETIINTEQLSKLVDATIIEAVQKFLHDASKRFNRVYSSSVFYGLSLHLQKTADRVKRDHTIPTKHITDIVKQHKEEYVFCLEYTSEFERLLGIQLPIDEIVLLAMFIRDKSPVDEEKHPVVLVVMHGDSIAASIVNVVRQLLHIDTIYGFDLSLNQSMQDSYVELKNIVQKVDQGKGLLVIYDMGSIKELFKMIQDELGTQYRLVNMPTTLIAMEYARKSTFVENLSELYSSVSTTFETDMSTETKKTKVIVTLCHTGEGGAIQLKEYLIKWLQIEEYRIIPLALSDMEVLKQSISSIQEEYEIVSIIGSFDPNINNIRFISFSEVFNVETHELPSLVFHDKSPAKNVDYQAIYEYLDESLEYINIEKVKKIIPEVISELKLVSQKVITLDQELGLFVHIVCSVNRILANEKVPKNKQKEMIVKKYESLFNRVLKIMKKIEKAFGMIFPDDEIANVISIIEKL